LIDYQGYFNAVKRKRLDTAAFISFLTAKYKTTGYLMSRVEGGIR